MKNRTLLFAGGFIGLIIVVAAGWYLASPLLISNTVDEAFPFEMPDVAVVEAMSVDERQALEDELMDAVPDADVLDNLSADEMAQVEAAVQEAAAVVMQDKSMDDAMPEAAAEWVQVAAGEFVDADSFHLGEGTAVIFQQDDERILRFEDFMVTNGPDLHVILSKHPAPASRSDVGEDYIDLGSIKGNIGNQNYEIPADVDLSEYQSVVIYCVPFHVVFSTATLN